MVETFDDSFLIQGKMYNYKL